MLNDIAHAQFSLIHWPLSSHSWHSIPRLRNRLSHNRMTYICKPNIGRKIVHIKFCSHNPIQDLKQSCVMTGVRSVRDNDSLTTNFQLLRNNLYLYLLQTFKQNVSLQSITNTPLSHTLSLGIAWAIIEGEVLMRHIYLLEIMLLHIISSYHCEKKPYPPGIFAGCLVVDMFDFQVIPSYRAFWHMDL